jgi:hypothetical protein
MPIVYGQKSQPQTCACCREPSLSLLRESQIGMYCPDCKQHLQNAIRLLAHVLVVHQTDVLDPLAATVAGFNRAGRVEADRADGGIFQKSGLVPFEVAHTLYTSRGFILP